MSDALRCSPQDPPFSKAPNWQWTSHCAVRSRATVTDPRPGAAREDGTTCNAARVEKERKYGELTEGNRCRLVVVALETGGRWSAATLQFVESLAHARARERPPAMAPVRVSGMEAEVVSNAVRVLRPRVCHISLGRHAVVGVDGVPLTSRTSSTWREEMARVH